MRLFGISQGHSIGVPNSLGVRRGKPQQVEDSSLLFMPIPKDPLMIEYLRTGRDTHLRKYHQAFVSRSISLSLI